MIETLTAVLPVFLVILVGFVLRRARWLPDAFWAPAENMTYTVTFPALLVANLASADMGRVAWAPLMAVQADAVVLVAAGAVALRKPLSARLGLDGPAFGSVFQGMIRPNTYVGLAFAAALFGDAGVTLTAICVAVVVPLVNVLSVLCLSACGSGQAARPGAIARGIATNPLILACALGIGLNASGLGLPPVIGPTLEILGRAALPVALLAVGAGLSFRHLGRARAPVAAASGIKLALLPALVGLGCVATGLDGPTTTVAVLYAGLPCSASSYVLARRMGGDAPLIAGIITAQTLASALTIPALLSLV